MSKLGKIMIAATASKESWFTCVICENEFSQTMDWGNNAEPVKVGTCCSTCNDKVVIPARMDLLFGPNK